MPFSSKSASRQRKIMVPGLTALICLTFFIYMAWMNYEDALAAEKTQAIETLSSNANSLSSTIKQQIDKAQSLVVFTQYANEKDMNAYTNQLYSQQSELVGGWLLTKDAYLTNADSDTLSDLKIGTNLADDPNHEKGIIRVLQTRRTVLASPLNKTIEGSITSTLNCYIPIFSYQNNLQKDIQGTFIVLLNINRLMGQSGLLAATRTYQFALFQDQDNTGQTKASTLQTPIFSTYGEDVTSSVIQSNRHAVTLSLDINNATWLLYASPIKGWQPNLFPPALIAITGIVLALLSFAYLSRLINSHDQLNRLVDDRTKQLLDSNSDLERLNRRLEDAFNALKIAQEQLIRNEKLASLGSLVAGVAHEINTPLGTAVTVSSYLNDMYSTVRTQFQGGDLSRSDFLNFIDDSSEGFNRLDSALQRVIGIIRGFKTVTVDQSNLEASKIYLSTYLNEVISTVSDKIQEGSHKIQVSCPTDLEVVTFPQALGLIITNLVMNSLIHGFDGISEGLITVDVTADDQQFCIRYADNGIGIPDDIAQKIFEPFFTTKRLQGCTGLGLHIVNNMATQVLKGQLDHGHNNKNDASRKGVIFDLCLPRHL